MAGLRGRVDAVRRRVRGRDRPRVLVLEWSDPPFNAGHWVPDQVEAAGGEPVLAEAGARSRRLTWEEIAREHVDVTIFMPCGFDLAGAVAQAPTLLARPEVEGLGRIIAVDANAYFSRPGPRVVDGVELLEGLLHGRPGSDIRCRERRSSVPDVPSGDRARRSLSSRVWDRPGAAPISAPGSRAPLAGARERRAGGRARISSAVCARAAPFGVATTSFTRRSVGCGWRSTSPARSRSSTTGVRLGGSTVSREASSDIGIGRRAIRRSARILPKLRPTSSLTSLRRSLFSTRSAMACHASLAARSRRALAFVMRRAPPGTRG